MPELSVTEEQLDRLEAVSEDLEAVYVGEYGSARPGDAIEYLLDTYTPPESADPTEDDAETAESNEGDSDEASDDTSTDGGPGSSDTPEGTLQQAMDLLAAHDDKWRESSGDTPYEVDLPDGSTEGVRTKDDIKRLVFKHWK